MKLYSCALVLLLFCVASQLVAAKKDYIAPKEVIEFMATREMRLHHDVWHMIRDLWNLLDENSQKKIAALGWAPPRPSQSYNEKGESTVLVDNGSGSDFLFMHRKMIEMANNIIKKKCPNRKLVGFDKIPAPRDKNYPVAPAYEVPDDPVTTQQLKDMKTDEFYWKQIVPAEKRFKDPQYLKKLELHQLGALIEFTIHNWLHVRFSKKPYAFRPQPAGVPLPEIDTKWDDPKYNWLADFYSAHVNPTFWKIHCWVDDRIEDWKKAHGLKEIQWKYTWVGGPHANFNKLVGIGSKDESSNTSTDYMNNDDMEGEHENHYENLQEVARVLEETGLCTRYYSNKYNYNYGSYLSDSYGASTYN